MVEGQNINYCDEMTIFSASITVAYMYFAARNGTTRIILVKLLRITPSHLHFFQERWLLNFHAENGEYFHIVEAYELVKFCERGSQPTMAG